MFATRDAEVRALEGVSFTVHRGEFQQWKDTVALMTTANSKGKAAGWMAPADWDNLLSLQKTYGQIQTKAPGDYYTNEFFDCK